MQALRLCLPRYPLDARDCAVHTLFFSRPLRFHYVSFIQPPTSTRVARWSTSSRSMRFRSVFHAKDRCMPRVAARQRHREVRKDVRGSVWARHSRASRLFAKAGVRLRGEGRAVQCTWLQPLQRCRAFGWFFRASEEAAVVLLRWRGLGCYIPTISVLM